MEASADIRSSRDITSYKSIDLDKWHCDFHASACRLASPNGNLKNGILWEGCPLPPEVEFIHFLQYDLITRGTSQESKPQQD